MQLSQLEKVFLTLETSPVMDLATLCAIMSPTLLRILFSMAVVMCGMLSLAVFSKEGRGKGFSQIGVRPIKTDFERLFQSTPKRANIEYIQHREALSSLFNPISKFPTISSWTSRRNIPKKFTKMIV